MSTKAGPLGLRLFLEGIEVPVISSQIQGTGGSPAGASIQIVPTNASSKFLPLTLAHLFYLDEIADEDAESYKEKIEGKYGTMGLDRFEVPDSRYKLGFCGVVIGFNYSKNSMTRSMILQCMDLSMFWDTCYQWYADYSMQGNAITDKSHIFVGAGSGLFDNVANDTRWVISNTLLSRPRSPSYSKTKGLLGGIISLLETVGGIRPDAKDFVGYRGVNDFFTISELRYNLLGMLGAVEADTTSVKMYRGKAFRSWLKNGMSSLGSLVTFRQILQHVGSYIFHDIYPNPVAMYKPGKDIATLVNVTSLSGQSRTNFYVRAARKNLKMSLKHLQSAIFVASGGTEGPQPAQQAPFASAAAPPAAKDSFRKSLVAAESALKYVEKAKAGNKKRRLESTLVTLEEAVGLAYREFLGVWAQPDVDWKKAIPKEVVKIPEGLRRTSLGETTRHLPTIIKEEVKPTFSLTRAAINRFGSSIEGHIETALNIIASKLLKAHKEQRIFQSGDHLYNQLILPETFFIPPPRCNVLFPDQYTEFSFSRNFMREVTRLSCSGGLGYLGISNKDAKLFGRHYFAPNIKNEKGEALNQTLRDGARVILPHEVHSGIIPTFERVLEGHRWGVKEAGKRDIKLVPYIQRLANFQFFMHRWSSRVINVQAKFTPQMVLGFPSLILDRSAPASRAFKEIEQIIPGGALPTQFLGKVVSFNHNLGQDGGYSSFALSHCRTHGGIDDEFVGILDREQTLSGVVSIDLAHLIDRSLSEKARGVLGDDSEGSTEDLDRQIKILATIVNTFFLSRIDTSSRPKDAQRGIYIGMNKITDVKDLRASEEPDNPVSGRPIILATADVKKKTIITSASKESTVTGVKLSEVKTYDRFRIEELGIKVPNRLRKPGTDNTFYFPSKLTINYTYQNPVRAEEPLENIIMPGWYDHKVWKGFEGAGDKKISNLTAKVYEPLLGTSSIIDDTEQAENLVDRSKKYEFRKREEPNIERAADALAIAYGDVVESGRDIHEFVQAYTRRPVASLPQILGSSDGTEGFHSNAFGDYNVEVSRKEGEKPNAGTKPMEGLRPSGKEAKIRRIDLPGWKAQPAIPDHLDPRGRARARVKAYAAELALGRGLQG